MVTVEQTREFVRSFARAIEPGALEALVKEDPGFAREAVVVVPAVGQAYIRLVALLSQYIEGLPPDERRALVEEALRLDGGALADAVNSYSRVVMTVHEEQPDVIEALFPAVDEAMRGIDFGKFRVACTALIEYWTELAKRAADTALDNPVITANLIGILPPLVNGLLDFLEFSLERMALPPEILASALFNTLSALDAEKLGRILSMAAGQINDLHAGNMILGRDEPRFRAVFTEFAGRVFDNLDVEAVAAAAAALGEDLEVAFTVLFELAMREPEPFLQMTRAMVLLTNSAARITNAMLADMARLSDVDLARLGNEARCDLDAVEIGRMIDLYVAWDSAFRAANPGFNREMYTKMLSVVNIEKTEALLKEVASDWKAAVLANPGVRASIEPEEVGRRVNDMLVAFNRSAAGKPNAIGNYMKRLFSEIDARELETAAHNVSSGMIETVFASAEIAGTVLKTAARNVVKVVASLVGLIRKRLLG